MLIILDLHTKKSWMRQKFAGFFPRKKGKKIVIEEWKDAFENPEMFKEKSATSSYKTNSRSWKG